MQLNHRMAAARMELPVVWLLGQSDRNAHPYAWRVVDLRARAIRKPSVGLLTAVMWRTHAI